MSIKFPILSIQFEDNTPHEFVDEFFQKYPIFTQKYRQLGLNFSQIKSYYESPLQIELMDSPYKVTATLNIRKKETKLEKMKQRGALIKKGRPRKEITVKVQED